MTAALGLVWLIGCGADRGLTLRSGVVRPSDRVGSAVDGPAVVAFGRPLRASDRAALQAAGWTPVAPVGSGWIVAGRGSAVPGASWVGALTPDLKVDPALKAGGDAITVAELAPGADSARVAARVRSRGLRVDGVGRRLVASLREDQVGPWVDALAGDPDVVWVSRRGRRELLDKVTGTIAQSGIHTNARPFSDVGLDGTGQIAGILDTGIDIDHCLFVDPAVPPATDGVSVASSARKVLAVDFLWSADDPSDPFAWDDESHGTHVAGILAGDENADDVADEADGVAYGAKLVIQDAGYTADDCGDLPGIGCPVVDLVPLFEQAYAQGARVHSNSWGDRENAAVTNTYSDGSADADQESWDRPDYLLVFASGNNGGRDQVFSPSNAKDTLSVGASGPGNDADQMESFSSGGPTADGRIKPDVAFPGVEYSALDDGDIRTQNCEAFTQSGTSMAAPGASGVALLVRQYFADGWYPTGAPVAADGFSPSSALVKAAILASAQPIRTDRDFMGWGRPQLDQVLPLGADGPRGLIALDEADTPAFSGGEDPFDVAFTVESGTEPLVVALVWRDPPATPLSDPTLVNDLDLVVHSATGDWTGNVLGDFWSESGGSPDRRNNVEIVRLERPETGDWTLEVSAHQVAIGPQPFALVISGGLGGEGPTTSGPTDTAVPTTTGPGTTVDTSGTDDGPTGGGGGTPDPKGCGCDSTGGSGLWGIVLLGIAVRRRWHGGAGVLPGHAYRLPGFAHQPDPVPVGIVDDAS